MENMEQTLIDRIINYCIGITALQQRENRDLLLRGLPSKPVAALARSSAPLTDLSTIIQTTAAWGRLPQQDTHMLVVVLENTRVFVEGLQIEQTLNTLLNQVQTKQQSHPADPHPSKHPLPKTKQKEQQGKASSANLQGTERWDVFISHAWEDKEEIARPLAEALLAAGLQVWFDEFSLKLGDSLRRSIEWGIRESRYGVVILSPSFFAKEWPKKELDALTARELEAEKVILPIWHNVSHPEVARFSPGLADRLAVPSSIGLESIVAQILNVCQECESAEAVTKRVQSSQNIQKQITILKDKLNVTLPGSSEAQQLLEQLDVLEPDKWLPKATSKVVEPEQAKSKSQQESERQQKSQPSKTDAEKSSQAVKHAQISTALPQQEGEREEFSFETVTVSTKGEIVTRTPHTARQENVTLGNGVTLKMVSVPGGTFLMGSPKTEKERSGNEVQHQVTVSPFFLGKYPVTQEQWEALMGKNPSRFQGTKRPVEMVSWHDTVEFCQKISEKTGQTYRLPTEAEWEYACRAGTTTPFYFGKTMTSELVNYNGNYPYASALKGQYRQETTEVGTFPPNAFGLYDMHGNVWEWCQDWFAQEYYSKSLENDPRGPDTGSNRVLRGGAWRHGARGCRSAYRSGNGPGGRILALGFRLLRT